jgi:integrase
VSGSSCRAQGLTSTAGADVLGQRDQWFEEGKTRRAWKPRTVLAYGTTLEHLKTYFGPTRLGSIRPRDVSGYTRQALGEFAPRTVNLHLNVLHDLYKSAKAEKLVESNPVEGTERPKVLPQALAHPRACRGWPRPASLHRRASAARLPNADADGPAPLRVAGLRWRDVDLVESVLRVRDSKSEEGERLVALSPTLAEELWQHRRRSVFEGDDERVSCHPKRGSMIDHEWYAGEFRAALKRAGITDYVRAFQGARHASLTNGAAAGETPIALMARAGHRSMQTEATEIAASAS